MFKLHLHGIYVLYHFLRSYKKILQGTDRTKGELKLFKYWTHFVISLLQALLFPLFFILLTIPCYFDCIPPSSHYALWIVSFLL